MIRDEAVLRTACGCTKIISVPAETRIHSQLLQVDPPLALERPWTEYDLAANATYTLRRFIYEGGHDSEGRRVFQERVERQGPWEQRYRELYNEVYGTDKGL